MNVSSPCPSARLTCRDLRLVTPKISAKLRLASEVASPFELVANSSQVRLGKEELLLALVPDLERQAADDDHASLLSCFERTVSTPTEVGNRYQRLAKAVDFVVALGNDLGTRNGIFHGPIEPTDALCAERSVVVITPQFSPALLARVAGGDERDRRYAFALVYDGGQVTRAARMLMSHIEVR